MPSNSAGFCAVFHRGLRRLQKLDVFLGQEIHYGLPADPAQLTATAGWGLRKYSRKAREAAQKYGVPFLCLEDGFLRSVGLGATDAPLSLVVDEVGIYYDSSAPSRLETLIHRDLDAAETERARALVKAWRDGQVSKYNYARDHTGSLPSRFVLVADQTVGDASIRHADADASSFQKMLAAALQDHPDCEVILKVHPEVAAGRKRGHFDLTTVARTPRVHVLEKDVHPAGLLARAEAIYVVTSQIGFEGLLWGKPVHTFGRPFYAGWGLSQDALPASERRKPVPLESLVHSALVDYPRYVDPETGTVCEVERVLDWLALQRRMRERFPSKVYAVGFSRWKKPVLRSFFQGSEVVFCPHADHLPPKSTAVLWGRKPVAGVIPDGAATVHIEDGFLRSVGLGADLIRPVSWVMDRQGIYYDATGPSDLESILETGVFTSALLDRAASLQHRILTGNLTKYNVGKGTWKRPENADRVILVPGQVESDASIRFGTHELRTCMGLLRAVREANPNAYVIYKPHPDVVAGLRPHSSNESEASQWCDEVIKHTPMGTLLPLVDEVHVLTSLAGFEALLRGKKVACYGMPFFAGWGLTQDATPISGRTRRLTLGELVAGTLILYPSYVSRTTGKFTTPERALEELLTWRQDDAASSSISSKLFAFYRRLRAKVLRSPSTVFGTGRA